VLVAEAITVPDPTTSKLTDIVVPSATARTVER
jgi:hypothetical protein